MSDFELKPPNNYTSRLLQLAPSFVASNEYQSLEQESRDIAGLVFSAFASFMEASLSDRAVKCECVSAIEEFAKTSDVEAHNLLVTEVFEGFRRPEVAANVLLPKSRLLFDRWC